MNVSWNKAKDVNHRQASEYQKQKKQTYKIQTGKQILETKKKQIYKNGQASKYQKQKKANIFNRTGKRSATKASWLSWAGLQDSTRFS